MTVKVTKSDKNDYGIAQRIAIASGDCYCTVIAMKKQDSIVIDTSVCGAHDMREAEDCCDNCEEETRVRDHKAYMEKEMTRALIESLESLL